MPEYSRDKTLLDNRRTDINFKKADIKSVLPEYFQEDYPLLITLLEKYYEFMDSSGGSTDIINQLYTLKDATSTPSSQLENLEDEYLLGTSYFGGFQNKREAIKFSNLLYRSKGTKYSIEQCLKFADIEGKQLTKAAFTTSDADPVLVKSQHTNKFSIKEFWDFYDKKFHNAPLKQKVMYPSVLQRRSCIVGPRCFMSAAMRMALRE